MFDWQSSRLSCEIQVKESIRDVQFLHNETMYAVAQKKYTYIYDRTGMEIHCLKSHIDVNRLQFLPYHFLLASVGATGYLKYQDTSTGACVRLKTRMSLTLLFRTTRRGAPNKAGSMRRHAPKPMERRPPPRPPERHRDAVVAHDDNAAGEDALPQGTAVVCCARSIGTVCV